MSIKKNSIPIALSSAFLLLCALLPLAFRNTDGTASPDALYSPGPDIFFPSQLSDRLVLYRKFRGSGAGGGVSVTTTTYSADMVPCIELLDKIFPLFIIDELESSVESEGVNFYYVTDETGATIRLAERYKSWYGDWKNWLVIVADIDTLDVYYVYLSSECLSGFDKYGQASPEELAAAFADVMEMELLSFVDTDKGWETVLTSNGRNLCYSIIGSEYYDQKARAHLIDYKLTLLSGEAFDEPGFTSFREEVYDSNVAGQ